MSSRIFIGKHLGRNEKRLQTVVGYVELSVHAMQTLRFWPEFVVGKEEEPVKYDDAIGWFQ